MSDILEDQRIHNIVKDYKRMFEEHDRLVDIGKQLQAELIAKDKELLRARTELNSTKAELNNIKSKVLPEDNTLKAVKSQLCELDARAESIGKNILTAAQRLEGLSDNIYKIKELLKIKL